MALNTVLWFGKQLEVVREGGRWLIVEDGKKMTFEEYQNHDLDSESYAMYTKYKEDIMPKDKKKYEKKDKPKKPKGKK